MASNSEFIIPAGLSLPEELIGDTPRELPASVRFGPLSQSRRKAFWAFLVVGAVCFVLDSLPFIGILSLYILPLDYLKWVGGACLLISVVGQFFGGEFKKATLYIEEGEVAYGRVMQLLLVPTNVYNGQTLAFAFCAAVEVRHPATNQLTQVEVKSRGIPTHLKDRVDTHFRVGDYVPIVWLPGRFEKSVQIYDFLELTPENSLDRLDANPKNSLVELIQAAVFAPLFFILLFWNVYAYGRYEPIEFSFEDGVAPIVVGAVLGLGLTVFGWLVVRRQRIRIAERNAQSSLVGRAVELEYESGFLAKYGLGAILVAGAMLLGGATVLCWCFTANALLDNSPVKESAVDITNMIQVTHSFIFREYKLEYRWPGEDKDHSLLTTPDHLAQFLAPMGTARVRSGWLGWRWVETIDPLIVAPQINDDEN